MEELGLVGANDLICSFQFEDYFLFDDEVRSECSNGLASKPDRNLHLGGDGQTILLKCDVHGTAID